MQESMRELDGSRGGGSGSTGGTDGLDSSRLITEYLESQLRTPGRDHSAIETKIQEALDVGNTEAALNLFYVLKLQIVIAIRYGSFEETIATYGMATAFELLDLLQGSTAWALGQDAIAAISFEAATAGGLRLDGAEDFAEFVQALSTRGVNAAQMRSLLLQDDPAHGSVLAMS